MTDVLAPIEKLLDEALSELAVSRLAFGDADGDRDATAEREAVRLLLDVARANSTTYATDVDRLSALIYAKQELLAFARQLEANRA